MPVNMNSAISFRQSSVFPMEKEKGYFIPMPDGAESPKDKVELNKLKNTETKKEKGGFRNFIGNVAKFFTTAGEMIKASAKALWYGSLTGGATLLGLWAVSGLPKQIKNKSLKKALKTEQTVKIIRSLTVLRPQTASPTSVTSSPALSRT